MNNPNDLLSINDPNYGNILVLNNLRTSNNNKISNDDSLNHYSN
jgi:hypothetical protein